MSERARIFNCPVQVERFCGDKDPWGNVEWKDIEDREAYLDPWAMTLGGILVRSQWQWWALVQAFCLD